MVVVVLDIVLAETFLPQAELIHCAFEMTQLEPLDTGERPRTVVETQTIFLYRVINAAKHIATQRRAVVCQRYMVVAFLPKKDAFESMRGRAVAERQMTIGRHAQTGVATEARYPTVAERLRIEPQLYREVAVEQFVRVVFIRVLPCHGSGRIGEIDGVVLLRVFALAVRHRHHHFDTLHRRTRRTVGDTSRHGTGTLGKTDVGGFTIDDAAVGTFVLNSDAIVIVNARQCGLIGIEQILLVARQARQRLPCFILLFRTTALDDIGLGINRTLLIHLPR